MNTEATARNKVLVIMSSDDKCHLRNGEDMKTGFFLSELSEPLCHVIDAGFEPVFANPMGNAPAMDPRSDSIMWFKGNSKKYHRAKEIIAMEAFKNPVPFERVLAEGLDQYVGMFIPGGHAPMSDLARDKHLGSILKWFHERGVPIASICHGPAALLSAMDDPDSFLSAVKRNDTQLMQQMSQSFPWRGYNMTCFSNIEENSMFLLNLITGPRSRPEWYCESALRECGANYCGYVGRVCEDRELLTATDPLAADRLGARFVDVLKAKMQSAPAAAY
jgi:putative intracellular protease/amidase